MAKKEKIDPHTGAPASPLEDEELLITILAALPLPKIFQVRSICTLWYRVLSSPSFLRVWSTRHHNHHLHAQPPFDCCSSWLVMARKPAASPPWIRELIAFDSVLHSWISLGSLPIAKYNILDRRSSSAKREATALAPLKPPVAINRLIHPDLILCCFTNFEAFGSLGGLACFLCSRPPTVTASGVEEVPTQQIIPFSARTYHSLHGNDYYYMLVLNLLTGSHSRVLLPFLRTELSGSWSIYNLERCHISLQPLPQDQYRIFFQSPFNIDDYRDDYYGPTFVIFDSRTGCWKAGSSGKQYDVGALSELNRADFYHFVPRRGSIVAYNAEHNTWSRVLVSLDFMPDPSRFWGMLADENEAIFVQHGDRFLVASVQPLENQIGLAGFGVWELVQSHENLHHPGDDASPVDIVEVARTPRHLWEGFYEMGSLKGSWRPQVKLICSKGLICMTAASISKVSSKCISYAPLVLDLNRDMWYHLPPYKGHYDAVAVFGLRPSLANVAQQWMGAI